MRHRVQGRKLGLPSDQRISLLHNQVRQLFEHGAIKTTETRAKEVRRIAEKLITTAKQDDLHSRRLTRRVIGTATPGHGEDLVKKLHDTIMPQVRDRPGGYTRILKLGFRRGDAAPLVKLELAVD
jgi:large subunit ribosomal protein L17